MGSYAIAVLALAALVTVGFPRGRSFGRRGVGPRDWRVVGTFACVLLAAAVAGHDGPLALLAADDSGAQTDPSAQETQTDGNDSAGPERGTPPDPAPQEPTQAASEESEAAEQQPSAELVEAEANQRDSFFIKLSLFLAVLIVPFLLGWLVDSGLGMPDHFDKTVVVSFCVLDGLAIWLMGWVGLGVFLAVLVIPIFLGRFVATRLRMPDHSSKTVLVSFCVLAAVAITVLGWPPKLGIDLSGGVILVYEVEEESGRGLDEGEGPAPAFRETDGEDEEAGEEDGPAPRAEEVDMGKLIAAVKERVNPGGQKEVTIRQRGVGQIEIIVPEVNMDEVARLERIITDLGTLEFRILANNRDHPNLISRATDPSFTGYELRDIEGKVLARWVPVKEGKETSFDGYTEIARRTTGPNNDILEILVVVDSLNVTGEYLIRAAPGTDGQLRPCVNFTFNSTGGRRFARLTGLNKPDEVQEFYRKLGIILSGYLQSAPRIQTMIRDQGQITGEFSKEEVDQLVGVLNAGSLPKALKKEPVSRLVTGPQLGQDTIEKGAWAIAVSMVLVLLFMLFYYRFAGFVACMALVINLFLILAVMITIQAAFTLPGIAGLVLTVGMAVDANVLIFERIREELEKEAALRMAIRNGFARATTAIVDANLTTLITATVLYVVGTDQIKGFAVTLWLGVVMSMFTAIYCSRLVFDIADKRRWITALSMRHVLGKTEIDFLGKRRAFAAVSLVAIAVGLGGVAYRGRGILDIDFTGGVSIQVVFNRDTDIGELREKLKDLPDLAVSDVQLQGEPPNRRFIVNTSIPPEKSEEAESYLEVVKDRIVQTFPGRIAHPTMEEVTRQPEGGGADATTNQSAGPGPQEGARDDDPPAGTLLVSADPRAVLLAQAGSPAGPTGDAPASQAADVSEPATAAEAGTEQPLAPRGQQPPSPEEASNAEPRDSKTEDNAQQPAGEKSAEPADPSATPQEEPTTEDSPATGQTPPAEESPRAVPSTEMEQPEAQQEAAEAPSREPLSEEEEESTEGAPTADEPKAGTTEKTFDFGDHKVNYETVNEMIAEQIQTGDVVPKGTEYEVLSPEPGYSEDDSRRYQLWTVRVQLPPEKATELLDAVKAKFEAEPYFPSSNTIGGKVATGFRVQGLAAIVISLFFIVAYLWIRFQKVMYGLAAVVALVHDVLITLGMIALSALVAGVLSVLLIDEFKIGLPVLAAFLTIIGYSLNDTIVVFDRIREVKGKAPQLTEEMINRSINQTLSRTLLTSLTTLIVVLILYIGGGQGIHAFAFSLVVGVIVGTYSSIFVASPALLWMSRPPRRRTS